LRHCRLVLRPEVLTWSRETEARNAIEDIEVEIVEGIHMGILLD